MADDTTKVSNRKRNLAQKILRFPSLRRANAKLPADRMPQALQNGISPKGTAERGGREAAEMAQKFVLIIGDGQMKVQKMERKKELEEGEEEKSRTSNGNHVPEELGEEGKKGSKIVRFGGEQKIEKGEKKRGEEESGRKKKIIEWEEEKEEDGREESGRKDREGKEEKKGDGREESGRKNIIEEEEEEKKEDGGEESGRKNIIEGEEEKEEDGREESGRKDREGKEEEKEDAGEESGRKKIIEGEEEKEDGGEESDVEDNVDEQRMEEELVEQKRKRRQEEELEGREGHGEQRKRTHKELGTVQQKLAVQYQKEQRAEEEEQPQELREQMAQTEEEEQHRRMEEEEEKYERKLEEANQRIHYLALADEEKQKQIEQLHEKLAEALDAATANLNSNNHTNGADQQEGHEIMRLEMAKLEQKLKDANQEKDYYKKHFKGENAEQYGGIHNGRGAITDDFGRELMMANKRKYQLESRVKQLELELRDTQQRAAHLGESVKSVEKLLWLEKERSATLEREREQLGCETAELRSTGDALRRELELLRGEGDAAQMAGGESQQEMTNRIRGEFEQRVAELRDMKHKVEWRLGEVTQQYHDTKWRLGEVEATLAHRDWEMDQAKDRIKQLEASVAATPTATLNEELERVKEELGRRTEEKGKLEWRLGEVNQWWNDAKWRVGELEAQSAHRSQLLDQAHHRIGELERRLENNLHYEDVKRDKELLEGRVGELDKAFNDAKWRVGELEAALRQRDSELGGEGQSSVIRDRRVSALLRDGTFLIRKQPNADRHKWKLLTFENVLADDDLQLRRCWFETESADSKSVFLIGSFVNWECALQCNPIPERPTRRGIWLDLAPGRYEFLFIRDGEWHTEASYGQCWNEHGTRNNWIGVE